MKLQSNLDEKTHKKLENYFFACSSVPYFLNKYVKDQVVCYELEYFNKEDEILTVRYFEKELKNTSNEKIEEYKQLKLL